jgi:hypothetical protein
MAAGEGEKSVYATAGLLDVLLELARDAEPRPANVALIAVPAADLDDAADDGDAVEPGTLDAGTPVFAEFYFPDAGESLTRVFGVDLSTPAGQTQGRFLSHPRGDPEVSLTDDLHAVLLVAVPPWEPGNVRAYARSGRRLSLRRVAGETGDVPLE